MQGITRNFLSGMKPPATRYTAIKQHNSFCAIKPIGTSHFFNRNPASVPFRFSELLWTGPGNCK